MGLLKRILGSLTDSGNGGSRSAGGDNYICPSCRSTFKRQHQNCPECGSPILVPAEEADVDDRRL